MPQPFAHQPRKRFGQHFLNDQTILAEMVAAIAPQPDDTLVEIGPGLGALSEPLLARLYCLHAIEIDRDLAELLRKRYPPERLALHECDALKFDFVQLSRQLGAPLRIAGNLPYNISTPLLFRLVECAAVLVDAHLMLQKEVVERVVAAPGTASCSRLSVMMQYRFYCEWLLDVTPESFDPPPKVESAVLRLSPRPAEQCATDFNALSLLVSAAFGQRRKMLRNTLRGLFDEAQLDALGINPTSRAESLSIADYLRLACELQNRAK